MLAFGALFVNRSRRSCCSGSPRPPAPPSRQALPLASLPLLSLLPFPAFSRPGAGSEEWGGPAVLPPRCLLRGSLEGPLGLGAPPVVAPGEPSRPSWGTGLVCVCEGAAIQPPGPHRLPLCKCKYGHTPRKGPPSVGFCGPRWGEAAWAGSGWHAAPVTPDCCRVVSLINISIKSTVK